VAGQGSARQESKSGAVGVTGVCLPQS
jgi:hypothetical protein